MSAPKTGPDPRGNCRNKKVRAGAPAEYDDSYILAIAAELLAWPAETKTKGHNHALRKAIAYIPGSDQWPANEIEVVLERLKKKFRAKGRELIEASKSRKTLIMHNERAFDHRGPLLPSLLDSPRRPEVELARSRASKLALDLSDIAALAADLSEAIKWRLARSENPGFVLQSRDDQLMDRTMRLMVRLRKELGNNSPH